MDDSDPDKLLKQNYTIVCTCVVATKVCTFKLSFNKRTLVWKYFFISVKYIKQTKQF